MLAICLGSNEKPHIHVASSGEAWPKNSYLHQLGIEARLFNMANGHSGVVNLIKLFNSKIDGGEERQEQFLRAGLSKPSVSLLKHFA